MKDIKQIAKRLMELETTIRIVTDKEVKAAAMQEVIEITDNLTLEDMLEIDEYIMAQIDN
jgi:hypothetical protein